MIRTETIEINVDDKVWENAELAFGMAGITLSEAVNNFLTKLPPPPERIIVNNDEELLKILEEADEQVRNGNYLTRSEISERLLNKYGIQA